MTITATPGTLLTNPAQTQDIGSYYVSVTTMRNMAYAAAVPQMRARGLVMDLPTSEEAYAIPMGPISIGNVVIYKDGDRPGGGKPQLNAIRGTVAKRGITPLRLSEGDRMASRIPITTPNIMARGRAERLMEDNQYSAMLEGRLKDALGATVTQLAYDNVAFFSAAHLQDPVAATGNQSNLLALPLTTDNLGAAKQNARTWKAENGDPLFAGFTPEWLLEVPAGLEKTAEKICKRSHVAEAGASLENIEQATPYFVNPWLTDQKSWYLHITNAGMPMCYRVVYREMQRWDLGPDSNLYQTTKSIEIYADEWTDYKMLAWPLCTKSTPA